MTPRMQINRPGLGTPIVNKDFTPKYFVPCELSDSGFTIGSTNLVTD